MRTQVHHLVTTAAAEHAERPAVTSRSATSGSVTLTYAQLQHAVRAAGAGLRAVGLRRAGRVAVYLDKRAETVAAMLGASAAGGVFVPVNAVLRPPQVGHILADSGAEVLVTSPERWAALAPVLDGLPALRTVVLVGEVAQVAPDGVRILAWGELTSSDATGLRDLPGVIDGDVAAILYTSGSTGRPKGVVLSHRNLLAGAESVSGYLGNTADDVILSVLPLSFDAGLSQLTTAFAVGAHVVLLNYLLPQEVPRLCARHGVTGITAVPPLWIKIADQDWPAEAVHSMRYFANTGGRMPRTTLDRLRQVFPKADPFLMYGLTEAFRSTYLDPGEVDARPDSIGKAIPNAEVLVLRPDGSECDPGEHGELVHRGALVALGYWNDPVKTAERFRPIPPRADGVVRPELAVWSGDTVTRDADGFLYFVGRTDEMIKTSGFRVSPTEVEELAYGTGLVRDAVALGVDDAELGQHVVLVVSAAGDAVDPARLLADLRSAAPSYMVPRRVVVVPEIPRSPNGKFDRTRVREEHATP